MPITALMAGAPVGVGSNNHAAVKAIQLALRSAGHELVADGLFGKMTAAAVKDFEQSRRLPADGVVDMATAAALDALATSAVPEPLALPAKPLASALGAAPWLSAMRAITGTKELSGAADSPVILSWVKEIVAAYPDLKGTVGWYNHDSIPWCGLGAAICMVRGGFKPPRAALGAANWFTDWRDGYRIDEPAPGAVLIKTRQGGNHVTFIETYDSQFFYCRGANQSDMVNVAAIRKDATIRGFMWPKGGPLPGKPVFGSIAAARAGSEA